MMKGLFVVGALALAFASFACAEEGDEVLLNGRLFDAHTMESAGGGCSMYLLGSKALSQGALHGPDFVVAEAQTESAITITVTPAQGSDVLATRAYDAAFFQSGRLDEFTASSASGAGILLRYWGKFHPSSDADCTPLDEPGPR
jgi:hypothetical protein